MKANVKLKGQLKLYMLWPVLMAVFLVVMNVGVLAANRKAGLVMSAFVLIYIVAVLLMYFHSKAVVMTEVVDFASKYGFLQNILLKDLTIPYAILMDDGKILWANDMFQEIFGDEQITDKYLSNFIHDLNRSIFPKDVEDKVKMEAVYNDRTYSVVLTKISMKDFNDPEKMLGFPKDREFVVTVTLDDVTDLHHYMEECEGQKLVAGLIYIDNYEEVMESVEEVRQSLLVALIDRKVNQYMSVYDGLVRKLEKDKYFFVVKKECFLQMEKNKFSILEEAKTVNIGNNMAVTLSMGMGTTEGTYAQRYAHARVAIDLALARGGDQAVVKNGKDISYYGGKREQTAKNTRVKARVKAEALREFMSTKDKIFVMGHRIADADSFGAAIGIYRAAKTMEKRVHIVLNEVTASVRPYYDWFCESAQYPEDMFLTSAQVHEQVTENSMVIVVDTNRPEITECPELLKMVKTMIVFDHHRQSSDHIDNTVLSYIEPYASSSCEMIAEMLQYFADDVKVAAMEANSMYAGIMIDTNNFMNRTGVRTFEAAAFLRRSGADITYVRKLNRDDLEWYREKSRIVSNAEIFHDNFAIAIYDQEEDVESPTIIGAQAANDLLNIKGIKASFVLTEYYGKIYVSARSIDEVNVQLIMERLGGGGHLNTAGAQFQHTNMMEAIRGIKTTIQTMIEEGDL